MTADESAAAREEERDHEDAASPIVPPRWPRPVLWPSRSLVGYLFVGTYLAGLSLLPPTLGRRAIPWVLGVIVTGGLILIVMLARHGGLAAARIVRLSQEGKDVSGADWRGRRDVLVSPPHLGPQLALIPGVLVVLAWDYAILNALDREVREAALIGGPLLLWALTAVSFGAFRGRIQVRLDEFPLRLGRPLEFAVATTSGGCRLTDVRMMLRCVCARRSVWGIRYESVWLRVVRLPPEQWPGPDEFVRVTFDEPVGAPATLQRLVRWELLVTGRTPWGRQMAVVRLPIYSERAPG